MNSGRFDTLARSLTEDPSRRGLLRGLASTALGLAALRLSGVVSAKKRRKKKRRNKKPRPNEFGCLNVGQACGGNDARCCSGICEGKKPKKGKNDTRRCVGHNAGICTRDFCREGGQARCDVDNLACTCVGATGKANFCGDLSNERVGCRVCQRDTDCEVEFGVGAACVVLRGFCTGICPATGDTACVSACACGPNCTDKECGGDGCGGSCGSCVAPETCGGGTCCLPDCNGKDCGDDGCGGSCGPCTGGSCQNGVCACPDLYESCGGACEFKCPVSQLTVRNPFTCDCCKTPTAFCHIGTVGECCSGTCQFVPGGSLGSCQGRAAGQGCTFWAECESENCQDTGPGVGTCA